MPVFKPRSIPKDLLGFRKHFKFKSFLCFCSSPSFPAIPIQTNSTSFLFPNPRTLSQLLNQRQRLPKLKQIHAQIVTQDLCSPSLISSLIHRYLNVGNLTFARILFNSYPSSSPPIILWNLMIRAYSKIQFCLEPFNLFCKMIYGSVIVFPDKYTFTFVITSCSHQKSVVHGEVVHGSVIKNGFDSDLFVGNSMINMYSVFGKIKDARKVFDEMAERDVFSWTSLVSGYAKNGKMGKAAELFKVMPVRNAVSWGAMVSGYVDNERYVEALHCFHGMLCDDKVKPNEAVLVCVLSACAHLGALDQGNWIHVYIDKNGITQTSNISTALIDMYAKCGRIDCASRVFNGLTKRDELNYTSMISGLSIHGLGRDALQVWSQMLLENVKPNDITVLAILNGCSHAGLIEEGCSIFGSMEGCWGIVPKIEHYGCYIDLLGRAGQLKKALEFVKSMPIKPDIVVWRSLLNACRIYRDYQFAEHTVSHIKELDYGGQNIGQVLLSNLYASLGKWDRVAEVRKQMGKKRKKSDLGCSWIEINGVVHEFRVADQLHPQIADIKIKLNEILRRARMEGYIPNTMQVSFDLSEEDKEQAVAWHSEKLALAFGLMSTDPGISIRVVKNLRTCEDCHSVIKIISKVYDREIIVRDRSRFHYFNDGSCSCNDYW